MKGLWLIGLIFCLASLSSCTGPAQDSKSKTQALAKIGLPTETDEFTKESSDPLRPDSRPTKKQLTQTSLSAPAISEENVSETEPPTPDNSISYFRYQYSGTILSLIRSYEIKTSDGKFFLTANVMHKQNPAPEIDPALVSELNRLCENCELRSWAGLSMTPSKHRDGESFSLEIDWRDGSSIRAEACDRLPDTYFQFKNSFLELLKPYLEEKTTTNSSP